MFHEGVSDSVRIISFQSRVVLNTLLDKESYYADIEKSREGWDYKEDIEQLNGYNPIWGFAIPTKFSQADLYCGLLEKYRCEMSLNNKGLSDFVCLELFIPKELLKRGITHNSCYYALVFPYIKSEYLHRVYNINYIKRLCGKYHLTLPKVKLEKELNSINEATFEDGFELLTMEDYDLYEDSLSETFPLTALNLAR